MSIRLYAKEENGLSPKILLEQDDIVDTLSSDAMDKALAAKRGKELAEHSHDLAGSKLIGQLPLNKGGTGVASLDALKTLLEVKQLAGLKIATGSVSVTVAANSTGEQTFTLSGFNGRPTVMVDVLTSAPNLRMASRLFDNDMTVRLYVYNNTGITATITVTYIAIGLAV